MTILPCRFMNKRGLGDISLAVLCYDWCLDHGAHVLSSSFGIYEQWGEQALKVLFFIYASIFLAISAIFIFLEVFFSLFCMLIYHFFQFTHLAFWGIEESCFPCCWLHMLA